MKILVTGATGFVGKHFLPLLLQQNGECEILTINRDAEKAEKMFPNKRCKHITINQMEEIKSFAPEIVFHLASFISSSNDVDAIESILNTNIAFGIKILDTLKNVKSLKLWVNIGTFAEYKFGAANINNAYFYSASKSAFKCFVDYYSNLSQFKYIHIVPYTIYGGEDTQKKIIDYIYDSFEADESAKMSGGEQILDFIHVNDVASFLCFIISSLHKITELPNGEVLHLGTGKGTSIKELAALMEKAHNTKATIEWGALPYRDMDVMHAVAPIGKLIELGWKTTRNLKEGIQEFLNKKTNLNK